MFLGGDLFAISRENEIANREKSFTISAMKYAFLAKNLRALAFELKVIFWAHVLTLALCLCPWFSAKPLSSGEGISYNAFQGEGFLLGFLIFVISLVVIALFADKLFETKRVKSPFPEMYIFLIASIQQILLIILVWSVLAQVGNQYHDASVRFGLFSVFAVQVIALVGAVLFIQVEKEKEARGFFRHPNVPEKTEEISASEKEEGQLL